MITKEEKAKVIKEFGSEFGKSENDAGCAAVQIAILTTRINNLKGHFGKHSHDYHSNRGLLKMIGRRKKLSAYMKGRDGENYAKLINKLGLRK
jgi:small subunit ribosomal protein S15